MLFRNSGISQYLSSWTVGAICNIMVVCFSQIISIYERQNRLKIAILKPKIKRILLQTTNLNEKSHRTEKKKALFKRICRQKCCQERGLQYGKTWRKYLQEKRLLRFCALSNHTFQSDGGLEPF